MGTAQIPITSFTIEIDIDGKIYTLTAATDDEGKTVITGLDSLPETGIPKDAGLTVAISYDPTNVDFYGDDNITFKVPEIFAINKAVTNGVVREGATQIGTYQILTDGSITIWPDTSRGSKFAEGTISFEGSFNEDYIGGSDSVPIDLGGITITVPIEEETTVDVHDYTLSKECQGMFTDENGDRYLLWRLAVTANSNNTVPITGIKVIDTPVKTAHYKTNSDGSPMLVQTQKDTNNHSSTGILSWDASLKKWVWNPGDDYELTAGKTIYMNYRAYLADDYSPIIEADQNKATLQTNEGGDKSTSASYDQIASVRIAKSNGGVYLDDEGRLCIDYTVRVRGGSANTYNLTDAVVTDIFTTNKQYVTDVINIKTNDGSEVPVWDDETKSLVWTVPTVEPETSGNTKQKHLLTYTAILDPAIVINANGATVSKTVGNSVAVETAEGKTASTTNTANISKTWIKKTGKVYLVGSTLYGQTLTRSVVKYDLDVQADKLPLSGHYTVEDQIETAGWNYYNPGQGELMSMLVTINDKNGNYVTNMHIPMFDGTKATLADGTVTYTSTASNDVTGQTYTLTVYEHYDADGKHTTSNFTFDIPDSQNYRYTLTYYVVSDEGNTVPSLTNGAGVGVGEGISYSHETQITNTLPGEAYIQKETDGVRVSDGTVGWVTKVIHDCKAGDVVTDIMDSELMAKSSDYKSFYYTQEQIDAIEITFEGQTLTAGVDYEIGFDASQNDRFTVTFLKDISSTETKPIIITYRSTANGLEGLSVGDVVRYANKAQLSTASGLSASSTSEAEYYEDETISKTVAYNINGSNLTAKVETTEDGEVLITWWIVINMTGTLEGEATLRDILPAGLGFVSGQIIDPATSLGLLGITTSDAWKSASLSEPTLSEDGQTVTWTVSGLQQIAEGTTNVYDNLVMVEVVTRVTDATILSMNGTYNFNNKAELEYNGHISKHDASVDYTHTSLSKEGGYDRYSAPYISYTVGINEDGVNMIPDEGVDTMTLQDNMGPGMSLSRDSVTVTRADGTKIPTADLKLTVVSDDENNYFTLEVPDDEPLTLSYNCYISGATGSKVQVRNTITFYGQTGSEAGEPMDITITNSAATLTSVPYFYVKKMDTSGNPLSDAQYEISEVTVENGELSYKVVDTITTGSDGTALSYGGNASKGLSQTALYAYREIASPDGYYLDEANAAYHYFSFNKDIVTEELEAAWAEGRSAAADIVIASNGFYGIDAYNKKGQITLHKVFDTQTAPNGRYYFGVFESETATEPIQTAYITISGGRQVGADPVFTNLPFGENGAAKTYYVYETDSQGHKLTAADDGTVTVNGRQFIISGDGAVTVEATEAGYQQEVTITNTEAASLTITKSFAGSELGTGELTEAQQQAITFTVTGPDDYTATKTLAELTALGGTWNLTGLKAGQYTVTEDGADITGYVRTTTMKVGANSGVQTVDTTTATISTGTNVTIAINNKYQRERGNLIITKSFGTGSALSADDLTEAQKGEIVFTITGPEDYEGPESITYLDMTDGVYVLENIPAGSYTVTETTGQIPNYSVTTAYTVDNATAATGAVTVNNDTDAAVRVTNTYEIQVGQLEIIKGFAYGSALNDRSLTTAQKKAMTFTVTGPNGYTASTTYDKFTDGKWTLTELLPGAYTVTETNANVPGYDLTTTYTVGSLTGNTAAVLAGGKATINVTNNYGKQAAMVGFNAQKHLTTTTGSDVSLADLAPFRFTLTEVADANGTALDGAYTQTVTDSDRDGYVEFTAISYDLNAKGDHYYQITEVLPDGAEDGKLAGVTYDPHTEIVKVTVGFDADGNLTATKDTPANEVDAEFTNTYDAAGSLTVDGTKNLTGRSFAKGEFSFTITEMDNGILNTGLLRSEKAGGFTQTVENAVSAQNADGSWSASFAFTIPYTAVGTYYYKITETVPAEAVNNQKDGVTYTTEIRNIKVVVTDNRNGTLSAAIVADDSDEVVFDNTYEATGQISLGAAKRLEHLDLADYADKFSFTLAPVNGETDHLANETQTATAAADGSITFEPITGFTLDDVGKTYHYVITEVIPEDAVNNVYEGITYDSTPQYVDVTVTKDNGDGTLTVTRSKDPAQVVFTNSYSASVSVPIEGIKDLDVTTEDDTFSLTRGMFSFTLTEVADAEGTPKANPHTETVTNGADASAAVGSIKFTALTYDLSDVGDHYYSISEIHGGEKMDGITYDDASYILKINIADESHNGQLTVTKTLYKDGEAQEQIVIEFNNIYEADTTWTPGGIKYHDKVLTGDEFTFVIDRVDSADAETAQVITGEEAYHDEKTNAADGGFTFETIEYSKVGTYYYRVSEQLPEEAEEGQTTVDGITYDTTVKMITVTVTDDHKGGLTAHASSTEAPVTFTNTYEATGSIQLQAEKLYNVPLEDGEFSFTITEVADAEGNTLADAYTETVTNDAYGVILFSELSYSWSAGDCGEKYYEIHEEIPEGSVYNAEDNTWTSPEGIIHDGTSYIVTVTIVDNEDGTLTVTDNMNAAVTAAAETETEVETSEAEGEGTPADEAEVETSGTEIVFTNHRLGQINVVKTIDGPGAELLTDEDKAKLTFTVTGPAAAEGEETEPQTWTFTYADMTDGVYTIYGVQAGTYTVAETNQLVDGFDVTTIYETATVDYVPTAATETEDEADDQNDDQTDDETNNIDSQSAEEITEAEEVTEITAAEAETSGEENTEDSDTTAGTDTVGRTAEGNEQTAEGADQTDEADTENGDKAMTRVREVPTSIDGTVADGQVATFTITNTYVELTDFEIVKTMTFPGLADGYALEDAQEVVFTVTAVYDDEVVLSNVYDAHFDALGTQTIHVDEVPVGAIVTIEETYSGAAAKLVAGDQQQVIEMISKETAQAGYTNQYTGGRKGHGVLNEFTFTGEGWSWTQNTSGSGATPETPDVVE